MANCCKIRRTRSFSGVIQWKIGGVRGAGGPGVRGVRGFGCRRASGAGGLRVVAGRTVWNDIKKTIHASNAWFCLYNKWGAC